MEYVIQAYTGSYTGKSVHAPDGILRRVSSIMDMLPVKAVIIGWNTGAPLYPALIDEVHRRGKEIYIWLPVFSEMSAFPGGHPAIDYLGAPHARAVTGSDDSGEDFAFFCPSREQNADRVKRIFEDHFNAPGFDGVFLDKIRYSSFGNGFAPAIGCFCDSCRYVYQENGVDVEDLLSLLRERRAMLFAPAALTGMRYTYEHPLVDRFFRVRAGIVTKAVLSLTEWFKARGFAVGLDLFAPLFAYQVGQDIAALSGKADFIKPMLYRVTDAPAGIPYESRRMREEFRAQGCEAGGVIERLWGVDGLCGESALQAQTERLKQAFCPVYIGMEVNHMPGVCMTDKAYVTGTACAVAESGLGCALSWDVLSDTRDHLQALADSNA